MRAVRQVGLLQFVQVRSDPKLLAVSDLSKSYRDLDKLGARDPGSHGFRVLASVSKSPFVGFAPWIIFSVVATDVGWEIAATAGLLSSAILSYPSFERGTLKILDYAGFIFFAALVVLGLFLARSELDWLEEYSTVISMGTIAVVVFGSLRFVPFTEQYARETVPKEVQQTASFKHTNRHLTTVWGFVFLVVAVDSLIQQLTDSSSALLDWVIPVAAIVGGSNTPPTTWPRCGPGGGGRDRLPVTRFFKDDGFQFATEIALGSAAYGAAEVGEVLAVVAQIKWRLRQLVRRLAGRGRAAGGRGRGLRGEGSPPQRLRGVVARLELLRPGFVRHARHPRPRPLRPHLAATPGLFRAGRRAARPAWQKVEIPFEETHLEGYVFRPAGVDDRRPLLILNNGSDGTVLDIWVLGGAAAVDRGYVCLTFDGPGQGQTLDEQGLYFRSNWESVITPVVDFALGLPGVDPGRVAVQGISQGGYWVPRAVAYEPRAAAAIADPGVVDVSTAMHLRNALLKQLEAGERDKFNRQMRWGERFSKEARFTVDFRGRPYGAETPFDMFHNALAFKLEPEVISRIRCPMLITDPEGEQFWPGQSQRLYDALDCPKQLARFTAADGADSHCEPKTPALRNQRILDWLDETL